MDYHPPPCELEKIMNLTLAACDALDGNPDGVIARSDPCKLHFNNGTVTAVAVAAAILDGLHDRKGRRAYFSYQPSAPFADATTAYDAASNTCSLTISGLGGEWAARFLELQDASTLPSLDNVTYDTGRPNLTALRAVSGKVFHVHSEQDDSIPEAALVRYYELARAVTFPGMGYNESVRELDAFYRLFLVPGAGYCGANANQPNGGWLRTTLQSVIERVEEDVAPATLDGTGGIDEICRWPPRPLCRESIDTWMYELDAFKLPQY
ncbi:hypothetical protein SLS58_007782 [Diplodia intermedia]|uniref:Carboxylic ester hydrolase n=1 Tax=Diplodia intermedia TaxID=856260 RepID=A0ABR3TJ70_9PEZI